MPAKPTANDYRYNYIIQNPTRIRILYLFTLISWGFAVIGLFKFFDLSIFTGFFCSLSSYPLSIPRTVSYFVNVFYPGFDLQEHEKKKKEFWANNHPTVDVFLPIAGEDIKILRQTWKAVAKLDYDNYQVYVLEDKVDLKARKLAAELGFNYLSRPNKGEYKKAGNLKYGYENSNGEFVVILDADFVPHKSFIKESIPYFNNPSIGIVQTPQYFETNDEIHDRLRHRVRRGQRRGGLLPYRAALAGLLRRRYLRRNQLHLPPQSRLRRPRPAPRRTLRGCRLGPDSP